jgi:hypothetical protein
MFSAGADSIVLKKQSLVLFLIFFGLFCFILPEVYGTPISLSSQIGSEGTISQQGRELLDVLYPGVKPPQESEELIHNLLLGFELSKTMAKLKTADFNSASEQLGNAVYGVEWKFSPLELFQILDGYKCSSEKEIPCDPSAKKDISQLREAYYELRRPGFEKYCSDENVPTFSQLHSWVSDGESSLISFISAKDNLMLSWNVLSRSTVATISALLNGAAEAEKGAASHYASVRGNLTKHYLRHNLERWVVFEILRRKTDKLKAGFIEFLKNSELSVPCKFVSMDTSKPVADVMVSYSGGVLGTVRTDDNGKSGVEMSLYRLGRLVNGDGWVPLSVYQQRIEVLFTNLNLNELLMTSKAVPNPEKHSVYYENKMRVFNVTTPGITLKVTPLSPGPDGLLGLVQKIEVSLSGQKMVETEPGKTVEFKPLYCGDYLLSIAGKDSDDVIIKTAARVISLESNPEMAKTVSISLPSSEVVELHDSENVADLVKAFEGNKDFLLKNVLEVAEYRKAQGYLFQHNRKTLGKDISEAMHSFQNISVGLKYKSVGLKIFQRIQSLSKKLNSLVEDLPQKLTDGDDLRRNLVVLIENYSSENFDLDTSKEYIFLEKYKMNLERAQSNYQELQITLQRLLEETGPAVKKYRKEVLELLSEYTEKYQLVKFTVGLTHDADFHTFISHSLQPLERLVDKARQLDSNKFLNDYNSQLVQLKRVVTNRAGQLKVLIAQQNERKTQLIDHGRLNLEPLAKRLETLKAENFNIASLGRLRSLVAFSDSEAGVTIQQQKANFSILKETSLLPELVITSREAAASGYSGTIPSAISLILPALELNGTISRNQEEGIRLEKRYNMLLHSSLVQLWDYETPAAEIREMLGKEKHLRTRQVNLETGEVSKKWAAPDILLKDVLSSGSQIDEMVKDLLGLYILEYGQREETDRKLRLLFQSAEFASLRSGGTGLNPADESSADAIKNKSDEDSARALKMLNSLKSLLKVKAGKLLYPRLDNQMGEEIEGTIATLRTSVQGIISEYYRNKAARLSLLAEKINPANLEEAPSEALVAEVRSLVSSETNNSSIEKLVKVAIDMNIPVGKSVDLFHSSAKSAKEYLEQIGY